ncbi:uncharacterized protein LOC124357315 isoform X1 [Homalodisca vitripennis]|uniref:uncharacterized protein LOC124357315 isoform X1 n=2 Tax=Homalodisca vitripennis TaxID=197043 RepID=UPI001EEA269B|nr:uncharacterized protein LOC124357315 isoform X1 [Homalodisca vitripennis]XP_046664947.1 uncharacterized protein LOC124357315 isoform X1 [Homalodisca vitripennis]
MTRFMECVAGFWSSKVEEESSATESWSSGEYSHHPPIMKSPSRGGVEEVVDGSMGELTPHFSRGSYRKYMNQLIRGNSDTEISNDKPFMLADRERPKSAVFVQDQLRRAQHDIGTANLARSKVLDGSNDTIHNSEENVFASGNNKDVFSPARRAMCSWSGRRKSASTYSDMTASTETLVGRDDSWDDSASAPDACTGRVSVAQCECQCKCPSGACEPAAAVDDVLQGSSRQRRTGVVTASGLPASTSSRVEALIQRYTQLIQQHMEKSATKSQRKAVRSSLPNLETGVSNKFDCLKKDKLSRKLRKFSLSFEKETTEMGASQSSSSATSPTYLALPTFRKSKKRLSTSPSSLSDEGCSLAAAGSSESPASPLSSDDGREWSSAVTGEDALSRCLSSDSAVECVDISDDEEQRLGAEIVEKAGSISSTESLNREVTDDVASSSKTYLLNEVVSGDRNDIELRSDRWFIEHYGSSVLERLNDRGKTDTWVADMGEVNLDRRMSEVDSIEGIDPGQERRESNLSCFTDDDEHPGYRYFRTPSVVVSDHSDDPAFASSSITLEEIERFRQEYAERQNSIGDSSSDCSVTSSWSNVYSTISALDAEFVLRTPERKASDCSSCSTLSGDEDPACEQVLQDVKTFNKV